VISADPKAKRIALSMKALQASDMPKVKHGAPQGRQQKPVSKPEPSMEQKLASLSDRFRSR
ncbi:MAG: hypothetical protein ACJ72H_05260, partial [Candidatus Sulfotelmatobacter sp.]